MNKNLIYNRINKYTSLLFVIAVFLFWGICYPGHLYYQEQFQLFLFNTDYIVDRCLVPGGLSFYISDFLVQFFIYPWLGALILTSLLFMVQLLTLKLAKSLQADDSVSFLAFLPATGCLAFLSDENALPGFLIGLILSLGFCLLYMRIISDIKKRLIFIPLSIIALYILAGSVYFIFIGFIMISELFLAFQKKEILHGIIRFIIIGLLGLLLPLITQYFTHYPFASLIAGIGYYRFPQLFTSTEVLTIIITILTPWSMSALRKTNYSKQLCFLASVIITLSIGAYWMYNSLDIEKEHIMRYDYFSRTEQWTKIIKMAEKKSPKSPLSVTCLNLALAKTDQLGDRMFTFYQNGTEGLIPEFTRDYFAPILCSEVFYHLGMINTAQRFMFEGMEAIPDYRKSARAYKRLAETNLINGDYLVARKYLKALQKALFYKKWATETLEKLNNESLIMNDPKWKQQRTNRYTEDFLFSNTEIESMLGKLLLQNPNNKMAFEYLLGYTLQNKDLEHFMQYYPLGKNLKYNHIPRSYQEALIFMWTQNNPNFEGLPWSISKQTLNNVTEFAHIYMKQKDAETILQNKYGDSYWFYLLFNK